MKEHEPSERRYATILCRTCGFVDTTPRTYKEAEHCAMQHHRQTGCEDVFVKEQRPHATIIYGYAHWDARDI